MDDARSKDTHVYIEMHTGIMIWWRLLALAVHCHSSHDMYKDL